MTTTKNTKTAAAPTSEAAAVLAAAKNQMAILELTTLAVQDGHASIEAAKDHLAALEKAAVDGLDVDAAAYNNAQTAITLKGRRQTTLETADMTERTTHLLRLFEAAVPINAAAQANVDATQAILDQAKRKAEEIKSSTAQATYCAAVTAGLPLVDYMGDLDGQLAIITGGQLKPLDEKNADLYRLHGRVFTRRGEILNCNHSRPHRG